MNISPLGNRAQEAMETAAQTRAEAAQGDVQAKVKLAQILKLQAPAQPAPAAVDATKAAADATTATPSVPPPPTGVVLNVKR
jgi:hypothetical protein